MPQQPRAMTDAAELFRHLWAEKATFYRCIMDALAVAKRQYRLQLADDMLGSRARPVPHPHRRSQRRAGPALVFGDFYRGRFLSRFSRGANRWRQRGVFLQTLHRAETTLALEDIAPSTAGPRGARGRAPAGGGIMPLSS